jgi:hypothetical protein
MKKGLPIFGWLLFVLLSALHLGHVTSYMWVDTRDYLLSSTHPFFSAPFLAGHRAPLFPLVLRCVDRNLDTLYLVQVFLAVVAFSFLTWTLWPSVKSRAARVFLVTAVLTLALSSPVACWNYAPLSESISNSLSIVLIALGVRVVEKWTWPRAGAVILCATLWVAERDANAFELLAVSGLIIVAVLGGAPKRNLVFVGAFTAMLLVASYSSDLGSRWQHASLNLVAHRILPNADATRYFVERGMPVTPHLIEQKLRSVNDSEFFDKPGQKPFHDWWMKNGRRTWATFLLTHPLYVLHPLFTDGREMYGQNMEVYESTGFHTTWRAILGMVAYPEGAALWAVVLVCGVAVVLALRRRGREWLRAPERWIPLLLVLLGLAMGLFNQHCDAKEIARHATHTNLHLRLGLWLALAQALDAFLE